MNDIERRMASGEPFTHAELCTLTADRKDEDRIADKTIQKWRKKGWIYFTRVGHQVLWTLTNEGRATHPIPESNRKDYQMDGLLLVLLLVLNTGISFWNARVAGLAWVEAKHLGGFIRLVVWCAAIQSAIGFSMVILAAMVFGAIAIGYLPPELGKSAFSLWYLLAIVPALGSGLIITIHSWIVAYRERSLSSMGVASWNTFAMAYDTYHAFDGVGKALSEVGKLFDTKDSSDNNGKAVMVVILLVIIAVLGGMLLTATIIKRYAGTLPLPAGHATPSIGGRGRRRPAVTSK